MFPPELTDLDLVAMETIVKDMASLLTVLQVKLTHPYLSPTEPYYILYADFQKMVL